MLLGGFFTAEAQTSLTPSSQMRLRELKALQKNGGSELLQVKARRGKVMEASSQVTALVKLSDAASAEALRNEGAEVVSQRGQFAVVSMALNDVERIASLPAVRVMDFGTEYHTHMLNARKSTGIDRIHQGDGLPQAYTGKGVVAGIVDTGIDPNHINFKDAEGNNRVKMFANISLSKMGEVKVDTLSGSRLASFSTDTESLNHGTHTMGIMAGSYRGDLSYGVADFDAHQVGITTGTNPYYGVAIDSDIAAAGTSYLLPQTMALGIDAILGYAWGNGDTKPDRRSVINLSIGTNMGPHDGTDLLNQYIGQIQEMDNPIIVLSAGNEGDLNVHCGKTFTEGDTRLVSLLKGLNDDPGYPNYCAGGAQVWSDTDKPLEVAVVMINASRNKVSKRIKLTPEMVENGQYWVTSSQYQEDESDIIDLELGKYFHGAVGLNGQVDPESGRYCMSVDFTLWDNLPINATEQYVIGIEVTGEAGQRADMYCNSASAFAQFTNYSKFLGGPLEGCQNGTADGSISSLACGDNTIVVGAYNTKDHYVSTNGEGEIYGQEGLVINDVSYFTSYGTLADGTSRPHVCAPGALIVSSNSRFYKTYPYEVAATTDGLRPYTWVSMQGTSQAAPHVAGALCLWLEADPTLTTAEAKDIIERTAVRDDLVLQGNRTQWGAGRFDAYEGLKEVLRQTTDVKGVSADTQRVILTPAGEGKYKAFLAGAAALTIDVYRMDGTLAASKRAHGDETTINLASLPKGIYVVRVNGKAQKVRI